MTFDTSGEVYAYPPGGNHDDPFRFVWGDLEPFVQGYVECGQVPFASLTSAALTQILSDCDAAPLSGFHRYARSERQIAEAKRAGARLWGSRKA
jgi:hypothetical protein